MQLVPENSHWPRLLVFPLLLVAVGGLVFVRFQPELAYRLAYCPLRDTTGIPCLTCGGTHSVVELVQGRWLEALSANPLVAFGTVFFLIWSVYAVMATVIPLLRRSIEMSGNEKRAVKLMTTLILLGTWAWEIWQFRF